MFLLFFLKTRRIKLKPLSTNFKEKRFLRKVSETDFKSVPSIFRRTRCRNSDNLKKKNHSYLRMKVYLRQNRDDGESKEFPHSNR
ncbi:hypothetical protein CH380_06620 [Leptospira adleri]|uniref:Uncharacterized protein n=1 Tax=Leptospira adleri TaxID=2023186 RepID=A0A2M9YRM5_9LEPT|nr:hypothetical protein CH380_06620 [Leptospira adleri]PJZ62643.1 hypothetical protein CH376_06580 [Leptospira adleri]